jgi:hypothetical protein
MLYPEDYVLLYGAEICITGIQNMVPAQNWTMRKQPSGSAKRWPFVHITKGSAASVSSCLSPHGHAKHHGDQRLEPAADIFQSDMSRCGLLSSYASMIDTTRSEERDLQTCLPMTL